MNQMINQANINQKSFKIINHGWYVAHCDVQYSFEREVYNIESGVFSLGMEKKIFVPENATDVTIKISVAVGVNWHMIESKYSAVMQPACFALYGTLFTPYALEINCAPVSDESTEDPTPPPPPPPCCCNCCNCCKQCQPNMTMEEYMDYLNNFYNQQNM